MGIRSLAKQIQISFIQMFTFSRAARSDTNPYITSFKAYRCHCR